MKRRDYADYAEVNRKMWNDTASVHGVHQLPKLLEAVRRPDFNVQGDIEQEVFAEIGLAGRDIAQLSCNNGRELLSLKKQGAGRCVGFDISEGFIGQGRQLAEAAGLACEFVRSDVYDIPRDYDSAFDIVYVTVGALGWLADLEAWFDVVARLLRPGGHLFIYEMHPILDMFDAETGPLLKHSYFKTNPYVVEAAPDYLNPEVTVTATSYWFHHKLSDIIGGCLRHGLSLTRFEEHGHDISAVFQGFEEFAAKPPLSYALVAKKQG